MAALAAGRPFAECLRSANAGRCRPCLIKSRLSCPRAPQISLTTFRGAGQQIMAVAIPRSRSRKTNSLRFRLGFRGRRLFCCPLRREDIVSVYHIVALADLLNGVTMLPPFAPRAAVTGI